MTLPVLTNTQKVGIATIALVVSFAGGRFSVQKSKIETVVTSKTDTKQNQTENTHTRETITTVKTPDGTVKIVDQITQVANTKTDTVSDSITHTDTTVTPPKTNTLNISALVANDFSKGIGIFPTYGVSVSKEILGPVTVGVFGLTNGTAGISIGLNF